MCFEFVRARGLVRSQVTVRKRDLGRLVFYALAPGELAEKCGMLVTVVTVRDT